MTRRDREGIEGPDHAATMDSNGTPVDGTGLEVDGTGLDAGGLDWQLFDDPVRLRFIESVNEKDLLRSRSLQRCTRLAATASASAFSQVSLIGSSQFVPAWYGPSYVPEQHSPLRDSLCSVTMASGGILRIDDAGSHPWTRDLPPVRSGAVSSYLGVPLRDPNGLPVGVLCVFDAEAHEWRDEDEALLVDLAGIVTRELELLAALETATSSEIRLRGVIADLVERPRVGKESMLRARAQYLFSAASPAGGDWIDWIELGDHLAFSIGDVAGHGLPAVGVMEELRQALRVYAIEETGPADALVKASTALRRLRPGEIATAMKANFDPRSGLVRFALAGHPPPLHLQAGSARYVASRPGPPLGYLHTAPLETSFLLAPGDRMLIYTDGVIERPGECLDVGFDRLTEVMERCGGIDDLDVAARTILEAMVDELFDDACLMLIQRPLEG